MSVKYGELVVLGYNGLQCSRNESIFSHNSRYELTRRTKANGVVKHRDYTVDSNEKVAKNGGPNNAADGPIHTVTYTLGRNKSIVVEYKHDEKSDMFQIGRSSEPQIDFTVVDTCLGAPKDDFRSPQLKINNNHVNDSKNSSSSFNSSGGKPSQSTISRYACRILIQREPPHEARVYAAGFDSSKNIFLGEKATKWHKKNGEIDGLTTNGVLILHPKFPADDSEDKGMYVWREVSVDGDVYTLRKTRSSPTRGEKVDSETNLLKDGTLIDLCGATLLFRSSVGLSLSPTEQDLEEALDKLNAGRPVCPVNLNTLVIPRHKGAFSNNHPERQPLTYLNCGHVQGSHAWGHVKDARKHTCPICNVESEEIIQLIMGMEPTFHLDSLALNYAFNSCGHIASNKTVKYWSRIPLPHGTNQFHPVCPFCTEKLNLDKPFVKLIFQDNCF